MDHNSICNNCYAKNICKIYQFMTEQSNIIKYEITDCEIYNAIPEKAPVPVAPYPLSESPYKPKIYQNFSEASKAERSKNTKSPVINFTNEIVDKADIEQKNDEIDSIDSCFCPTCKSSVLKNQLIKCEKCGKIICPDCCMNEPALNPNDKPKIICEECWDKE